MLARSAYNLGTMSDEVRPPNRLTQVGRAATWALVAAIATGVLAALSERLTTLGTALMAGAGFLLGWAVEQLSSRRTRAAGAVMLVVVAAVAAVALTSARKEVPGPAEASPSSQAAPGPTLSVASSTPSVPAGSAPGQQSSDPSAESETLTGGSSQSDGGQQGSDFGDGGSAVLPDPPSFWFELSSVRLSNAPVEVSAYVDDTSDPTRQYVSIWVENLSVGGADFSVYTPYGGTLFGWGGTNDDHDWSVTYILNPPYSGDYKVTVEDRETGAVASDTFYLEKGTGDGPYLIEDQVSGATEISWISTNGRACDVNGVNIVITYENVIAGNMQIYLPDDDSPLISGISTDSMGHGISGVVVRSDRCTGGTVGGFVAKVVGYPDGDVLASETFAVAN